MCGRARCSLAREAVLTASGVPEQRWRNPTQYRPSYNCSPGAWLPVMKLGSDGAREIHTMKWGLVPSFTRLAPGERPDHYRMFNARCEGLTSKPVFSRLLSGKRCVVLLDGFYEWHSQGGGGGAASRKQPYYITTADEPQQPAMYMAGLYDVCHDPDGEPLHTFTIITTDSSEPLTWLHDRMPVILTNPEEISAWLGEEGDGGLKCLAQAPQNRTALKTEPSVRILMKSEYEHPFSSEQPHAKTEEPQEEQRGEAGDKTGNDGRGGGGGARSCTPSSAGMRTCAIAGSETQMVVKSEARPSSVHPRGAADLLGTGEGDGDGKGGEDG